MLQPSRARGEALLNQAACVALYFFAGLQFIRYYVKSTVEYLNMPAYLSGHERLPFQERVLPILFLRPLTHSTWLVQHFIHAHGPLTPAQGPFYLLSVLAFFLAAIYTQKLYDILTVDRSCVLLVYPVFLFSTIWTYCIHSEADFSYPYDLLSLAFFTCGLYYIYSRSYKLLFAVILIGTFNRETTLFLIVIYILDAASVLNPSEQMGTTRLNWKLIPWQRVLWLSATWLAIKLAVAHTFAHNDASESFLRVHDNLHELKPRLAPALLNICGYTLPLVVLFRKSLRPLRFANYLLVLIPWFAVMFCAGVLVETRIYGELCSFSAVAVVLILENRLRLRSPQATAIHA